MVCVFVDDDVCGEVVDVFVECGVKLILFCCAGFDNVDCE